MTFADRPERRRVATEFVQTINATTFCCRCGAQPVEWHREHHERYPNARVSSLRTQGASVARIKREMDLCEPVCRRCHMLLDGRGRRLQENKPYQKGEVYVSAQPCTECGKLAKPTRRGRCYSCYVKFMGIR